MRGLRATDPGDAAAVQRALREEGYAYVPGLLDTEHVRRLCLDVEAILETTGWADARDPVTAGTRIWAESFSRIQRSERLHEVANEPALMQLLATVLDAPFFCHPRKTARIVPPDAIGETTQPHQDYPYIQGSIDTVTCWTPLHDVPLENGPLRVLPGSHRRGLLPLRRVPGPGGFGVEDPGPAAWYASEVHRGDVIIFHSLLVHAALPNTAPRFRLSTDNRYQARTAPVCATQLAPYRDVDGSSTWEQIGAHWDPATLETCRVDAAERVQFHRPDDLEDWHRELVARSVRPGPYVHRADSRPVS